VCDLRSGKAAGRVLLRDKDIDDTASVSSRRNKKSGVGNGKQFDLRAIPMGLSRFA
jgi:hypothetical protein